MLLRASRRLSPHKCLYGVPGKVLETLDLRKTTLSRIFRGRGGGGSQPPHSVRKFPPLYTFYNEKLIRTVFSIREKILAVRIVGARVEGN